MIYKYRMEQHIASLTTMGTPHLGTSLATHGLKRFGGLIPLCGFVGLNIRGFRDLTPEACRKLNRRLERFEEQNGLVYQTLAGIQPLDRVAFFMRSSHKIIYDAEGENDGLVSFKSAMWKRRYFLKTMDADHFNQVGWWNQSEAKAGIDRVTFEQRIKDIYLEIARGLKD
jgi:triacylglycerol lipase